MSAPDRDDLLAAYRAERGPSRAQAQRLWARVSADVEPVSNVRSLRTAAHGRGRVLAIAAVVLAAAAALVLALQPSGRSVEGHASSDPSLAAHAAHGDRDTAGEASSVTPSRPPAPSHDDAIEAVDPGAVVHEPTDDPAAEGPAASPTDSRAPSRPRVGSRRPPPAPAERPTDSLAEETSLLRRARAALSEGRPDAALELLSDYDRRFPAARLSEEADAVRTMARCRKLPDDPGALSDAFSSRHRGSLFRKQVDAACASSEAG